MHENVGRTDVVGTSSKGYTVKTLRRRIQAEHISVLYYKNHYKFNIFVDFSECGHDIFLLKNALKLEKWLFCTR